MMRLTSVQTHLLPNFFFLPFQMPYLIGKAFIKKKNEVNNQKVEHKVSGRDRVGVGRLYCLNNVASI